MLLRGFALLLPLLISACAPLPAGQGGAASWRPSPNFDQRRPNFVILHQTTNDAVAKALATLTDPTRKVSAHYLIARDGTLMQLVDESARAWHAGESRWGGMSDLNSASIGIELDNTGDEPFAEPQILALLALLDELRTRYRIPAANVLAHGDVAPARKVDPGRMFPWRRLAAQGFGLWCENAPPVAPSGFDAMLGLRALGYDIAAPAAARAAFRRHFLALDGDGELAPDEQGLLHCLLGAEREAPLSPATE